METFRRDVVTFIRATRDEIWEAITTPAKTRDYYYGTDILSEWTRGARWTSESGDELYLEGEIVDVDPPHRLVQTFHVATDEPAGRDEPSIVTWEITPMGDASRVRIDHAGMGRATLDYTEDGWELILSGMKTLLETSEPLKVGAPGSMKLPR